MDVSFFENKPLFTTHLQGERERKEDSKDLKFPSFFQTFLENCDVGFFQTLSYSNLGISNQFFETTNSNSNLNFKAESNANQVEKTTYVSSATNFGQSLKPSQDHNPIGTKNRRKTGLEKIFGIVYERKYLNQRKEINASLPSHESNPSQDQESSSNSQTMLDKISQPCSNSPNESSNDLDVPIVVRKGNKFYTNYPMSRVVSYKNISSSFFTFTSQFSYVEIPKNVQGALRVPE